MDNTLQRHQMKIGKMNFVRRSTKTQKSMESQFAWNGVSPVNFTGHLAALIVPFVITVLRFVDEFLWIAWKMMILKYLHANLHLKMASQLIYLQFVLDFWSSLSGKFKKPINCVMTNNFVIFLVGQQLYWSQELPILFLFSHLPFHSHAKYLLVVTNLCAEQQARS